MFFFFFGCELMYLLINSCLSWRYREISISLSKAEDHNALEVEAVRKIRSVSWNSFMLMVIWVNLP